MPGTKHSIAWLPENIRGSRILSNTDLHLLAGAGIVPDIDPAFYDERLKNIFQYYAINPDELEIELHHYAKELLDAGWVEKAWQVLLSTG